MSRSSLAGAAVAGVLALTAAAPSPAQRCGDWLLVSLLDETGRPIPPAELAITAHVTARDVADRTRLVSHDETPTLVTLAAGREASAIRSGCGLEEARFEIEGRGRQLSLTIRHVPGDAGDILLGEAPLAAGTFTVELTTPLDSSCTLLRGAGALEARERRRDLWSVRRERLVRVLER